MNDYLLAFRRYFDFDGRSSRREYWIFWLGNLVISLGLVGVDAALFRKPILQPIFNLAVLIPNWSIFFRRLHDINRSGWNLLWLFLPLIGWIVLLIYLLTPSTNGFNDYGPDPHDEQQQAQ
ncbi:MAG: DUF805 domain-containing protein [Victivallaceae bacterium]|nr:DUF805 domain-containing protein [Victivallaceae bacterium]